ncbi:MAG: hypothetical protein WA860_14105 [Acidimicrobiales bacterium]
MVTPLWFQLACPRHGGPAHARIHEAAHAVLAVMFGFVFETVAVHDDPEKHPAPGGGVYGGGVDYGTLERRAQFSRDNPRNALLMYCAGASAEHHTFGDTLPESFNEDLKAWKSDLRLFEGQTDESYRELIGESQEDTVRATNGLIVTHESAIRAVADTLKLAPSGTLAFDEVRSLVAAAPAGFTER